VAETLVETVLLVNMWQVGGRNSSAGGTGAVGSKVRPHGWDEEGPCQKESLRREPQLEQLLQQVEDFEYYEGMYLHCREAKQAPYPCYVVIAWLLPRSKHAHLVNHVWSESLEAWCLGRQEEHPSSAFLVRQKVHLSGSLDLYHQMLQSAEVLHVSLPKRILVDSICLSAPWSAWMAFPSASTCILDAAAIFREHEVILSC